MKISEITVFLEGIAPLSIQEDYDNCGLITGEPGTDVSGVLVCLDCTEEVMDEAIANNCNLVISHHPLLFGKGIKKINSNNFTGRTLLKAIRAGIAVYAIHTNLDNVKSGVNKMICEKLGLENTKILLPREGTLKKLVTFVPVQQADIVRNALFAAGAGFISNYSECSFNIMGTGTFRPNEGANPFVGEIGKQQREQEIRMEMIFPAHLQDKICEALKTNHPYEEVAYDVYCLENKNEFAGSGMIGELKAETEEKKFLSTLKVSMNTACIRHSPFTGNKIKKVAVCGGAGSFLLEEAISRGADVFVTGDFKYHRFFDAGGKILIADVGHYESEQFTPALIGELLNKKFATFAVRLSKTNTNPINYF